MHLPVLFGALPAVWSALQAHCVPICTMSSSNTSLCARLACVGSRYLKCMSCVCSQGGLTHLCLHLFVLPMGVLMIHDNVSKDYLNSLKVHSIIAQQHRFIHSHTCRTLSHQKSSNV